MPATISSSGTWTTLGFTATYLAKTYANVPRMDEVDVSADLRDDDLSELSQFVQLVADAYSIGFWPAAALVENALKILKNRDVPTEQARSYTP